jgi:hypothetical protein
MDLDSTVCEVHGHAKGGAAYGDTHRTNRAGTAVWLDADHRHAVSSSPSATSSRGRAVPLPLRGVRRQRRLGAGGHPRPQPAALGGRARARRPGLGGGQDDPPTLHHPPRPAHPHPTAAPLGVQVGRNGEPTTQVRHGHSAGHSTRARDATAHPPMSRSSARRPGSSSAGPNARSPCSRTAWHGCLGASSGPRCLPGPPRLGVCPQRQPRHLGPQGRCRRRCAVHQGPTRSAWSAAQAPGQAARRQGVRLSALPAGAAPARHRPADCAARDRAERAAGPPPVPGGAVAGLAGGLPARCRSATSGAPTSCSGFLHLAGAVMCLKVHSPSEA